MTDEDDLHTETFSSARGWTAIRVTHGRTGTVAERIRSASLKSAVEAQRECIAEIKQALDTRTEPPAVGAEAPVTRAEFDALAARVSHLERAAEQWPG